MKETRKTAVYKQSPGNKQARIVIYRQIWTFNEKNGVPECMRLWWKKLTYTSGTKYRVKEIINKRKKNTKCTCK